MPRVWTAVGCVPDLDVKASRIVQTRVVAVRATPAEARPGESVSWEALVVSPLPMRRPPGIDWAMCSSPRNPSDSITVAHGLLCRRRSHARLDGRGDAHPGAQGARAQASIPRTRAARSVPRCRRPARPVPRSVRPTPTSQAAISCRSGSC